MANLEDPAELAHLIAGALRIKTEEKQELLEERDVAKRLRRLSELLARELELISIGSRIQSQVQSEMEKGQREYFLRQQLKAIQEELGEVDEPAGRGRRAARADRGGRACPSTRCRPAERELGRFERLPPQSAEHGVIRTYLEWIVDLPWSKSTDDDLDLKKARRVLDRDHYDIDKVKERILEFLAVRKLKPDARLVDPLLRGPAGRRQDLARQVDRGGDGAQVRAHLGRRRARRVRDPRPPAHLHRRDARHDRPRAPRRRVEQPGADDRRDRQDGRRLPRRPVERDARGARPGAELVVPRPLPRPAVRPLAGHVHHDREPARGRSRRRCATGWR